MPRTCQAPAGDVPADKPLSAALCGRLATTSAAVEGVTFDLCAACAEELRREDDMETLQQLARSATSPASGSRCPLEIQRDQEDPRRVHVSLPGEDEGQPDLKWSGTWTEWRSALARAAAHHVPR